MESERRGFPWNGNLVESLGFLSRETTWKLGKPHHSYSFRDSGNHMESERSGFRGMETWWNLKVSFLRKLHGSLGNLMIPKVSVTQETTGNRSVVVSVEWKLV